VAKLSNSGETRVVKKSIFLWQKEKNQNLLSEKRFFHGQTKANTTKPGPSFEL
jgi:hypothetical protein